jgi:hypothetical protein
MKNQLTQWPIGWGSNNFTSRGHKSENTTNMNIYLYSYTLHISFIHLGVGFSELLLLPLASTYCLQKRLGNWPGHQVYIFMLSLSWQWLLHFLRVSQSHRKRCATEIWCGAQSFKYSLLGLLHKSLPNPGFDNSTPWLLTYNMIGGSALISFSQPL